MSHPKLLTTPHTTYQNSQPLPENPRDALHLLQETLNWLERDNDSHVLNLNSFSEAFTQGTPDLDNRIQNREQKLALARQLLQQLRSQTSFSDARIQDLSSRYEELRGQSSLDNTLRTTSLASLFLGKNTEERLGGIITTAAGLAGQYAPLLFRNKDWRVVAASSLLNAWVQTGAHLYLSSRNQEISLRQIVAEFLDSGFAALACGAFAHRYQNSLGALTLFFGDVNIEIICNAASPFKRLLGLEAEPLPRTLVGAAYLWLDGATGEVLGDENSEAVNHVGHWVSRNSFNEFTGELPPLHPSPEAHYPAAVSINAPSPGSDTLQKNSPYRQTPLTTDSLAKEIPYYLLGGNKEKSPAVASVALYLDEGFALASPGERMFLSAKAVSQREVDSIGRGLMNDEEDSQVNAYRKLQSKLSRMSADQALELIKKIEERLEAEKSVMVTKNNVSWSEEINVIKEKKYLFFALSDLLSKINSPHLFKCAQLLTRLFNREETLDREFIFKPLSEIFQRLAVEEANEIYLELIKHIELHANDRENDDFILFLDKASLRLNSETLEKSAQILYQKVIRLEEYDSKSPVLMLKIIYGRLTPNQKQDLITQILNKLHQTKGVETANAAEKIDEEDENNEEETEQNFLFDFIDSILPTLNPEHLKAFCTFFSTKLKFNENLSAILNLEGLIFLKALSLLSRKTQKDYSEILFNYYLEDENFEITKKHPELFKALKRSQILKLFQLLKNTLVSAKKDNRDRADKKELIPLIKFVLRSLSPKEIGSFCLAFPAALADKILSHDLADEVNYALTKADSNSGACPEFCVNVKLFSVESFSLGTEC